MGNDEPIPQAIWTQTYRTGSYGPAYQASPHRRRQSTPPVRIETCQGTQLHVQARTLPQSVCEGLPELYGGLPPGKAADPSELESRAQLSCRLRGTVDTPLKKK